MPLQLVTEIPPIQEVALTTRAIMAGGYLIERDLVDAGSLASRAKERDLLIPNLNTLERYDRDGAFSPIALIKPRTSWGSWSTTDPYPVDGVYFRDEHAFAPWSEIFADADLGITADEEADATAQPLYSEWQLLYLDAVRDGCGVEVPIEVILEGGDRLAQWVEGHRPFVEQSRMTWTGRDAMWHAAMKLLLRVQARYWPLVQGWGKQLIDLETHEYVSALDREYDTMTAEDVRQSIGTSVEQLGELYAWLGRRAQ